MVYKGMKKKIFQIKSYLILFSLEVNNYLLSHSLNDDKLHLYQSAPQESEE
jgi:hypothetical protein